MTSDDDATTDLDELDDSDLPLLSAADETFVRDLLGALPPVELPDDLAARLDAALQAAARDPLEEPTAAAAGVGTSVGATVVALDDARARSRGRRTRVLQVAAVGLLVVAGVLGVVKLAGSGSVAQTSTAAGAGAAASAPAVEKTLLTRSGHAYSDATLVSDVRDLAAHKSLPPATFQSETGATATPPGTDSGNGQTTASPGSLTPSGSVESPGVRTPQPSPGAVDAPAVATRSGLVACLATVEEGLAEPVTPLAVDQGTYRGQAALVVVLPGALTPSTSYDVFVVGVACGENGDAHLLTYVPVQIH